MVKVITIGGAVRDITFYLEEGKVISNRRKSIYSKLLAIPLGKKVYLRQAYFSCGGGATNIAVSLANLGISVAPIIRVGQDQRGKIIINDLKEKGIITKLIQTDRQLSTGLSFVIYPPKQLKQDRTILSYRGANDELKINYQVLKQIKYQWIYLSSLSGKKWTSILSQIVNFKLKHPLIKIAWNPGSNQLKEAKKLNKLLSITDVLLLNKEEASELIGAKLSVNNLLKRMVNLGPKIAVITQGKLGANVYNGQQNLHQSISRHQLVDATGAGDAFGAGFIAGLILFNNLKKALDLAIRNSGSVVGKIGAQQGLLNRKKYN